MIRVDVVFWTNFTLNLLIVKMDGIKNIDFENFITHFKANFEMGLPGKVGQHKMKPYVGIDKKWEFPPSRNAKKGAVFALLYPVDNLPHLALMQRPDYDGTHGGQISFPGGKIEENDRSPLHAALREANEK